MADTPPLCGEELGEAFEVLGGGCEEEVFGSAGQSAKPQAAQVQMSLQMREQHFDLRAARGGGDKGLGIGQRSDRFTGLLVDEAEHSSGRAVRAARLERAVSAGTGAGLIPD